MYYDGVPLADIALATGISPRSLTHLADRCLSVDEHGAIQGFRGAIPYNHIRPYVRVAPVAPKGEHQRGGMAGALSALLDRYPDMDERLVEAIQKKATALAVPEFRLSASTLHRIFLEEVRRLGVSGLQWPLIAEYHGYRTICRFMKELLDANFEHTVLTREEQSAKAHLPTGKGIRPLIKFDRIYQAVEIDAHRVDAHLTVVFKTPDGFEVDVRLSRLWLLAAVERASSAVLAFLIVYRTEVSADDVLRLLRMAVDPAPRLPDLTIPGLVYPPDSGFPCQLYPRLKGAVWAATLMDRAVSNQANSVRERARRSLGFALNWGPARHFERRPNIERLFAKVNAEIFGRLPSTTGHHPRSRRAPHAEREAVRLRIRADAAEQQVAIHVMQTNATPSEGRFFLSPLDVIGQSLSRNEGQFMPRLVHQPVSNPGGLLTEREVRTVRGGAKDGRRPYIAIDRVRYTSPVLVAATGLIGKQVIVEIDEEDMRYARVFLMDGSELGIINPPERWTRTKHDRKTRRAINSLLSRRLLIVSEQQDPVRAYLGAKSTTGKQRRRSEDVPSPRDAVEAARVARDGGLELQTQPAQRADNQGLPADTPEMRSTPEVMSGPPPDVRAVINRGKRSRRR